MIELNQVTKYYGNVPALHDLSLHIQQGEVVGLLGPNGAGKSTLIQLVAGLLHPDKGTILPQSADWPRIGYKPERLLFPNRMRVVNYLKMCASLSDLPTLVQEETVLQLLTQLNLLSEAQKKIGACSKGMRQRIGIAQALLGNPDILLLDEPTSGLDPYGQAEITALIQSLHARGKTILISSHQLEEITAVASRIVILRKGQIRYNNSIEASRNLRPHTLIVVDRPLLEMAPFFTAFHPEIKLTGNDSLQLHGEAIQLRRHILSILIGAGYDILYCKQKEITLAQLYKEAIH